MRQLTVRGIEPDLEARLRTLASREGVSLNQAALRLMRRGAGLGPTGERGDRVGSSLDALIGGWSEEEARELLTSIEPCEGIDAALWE